MSARLDLEHEIWKFLKREELTQARFLLACSGGADSVALVTAFAQVIPLERLKILHVHHGGDSTHRADAMKFTEALAADLGIDFSFTKANADAGSEAGWREVRWNFFHQEQKEWADSWIVTAHHAEDLLETRMIRLLRGTGPDGLKAILPRGQRVLRPFLSFGPARLKAYLVGKKQTWIEDPSNRDPRFLRNWLRHRWFPELETKRPGSLAALARSFELMVEAIPSKNEVPIGSSLPHSVYLQASPAEKRRWVARLLVQAGKNDFSFSHVEEIRRNLDKARKSHTFKVAGCLWTIDAQQIEAQRVEFPGDSSRGRL